MPLLIIIIIIIISQILTTVDYLRFSVQMRIVIMLILLLMLVVMMMMMFSMRVSTLTAIVVLCRESFRRYRIRVHNTAVFSRLNHLKAHHFELPQTVYAKFCAFNINMS